MEKSEIKIWLLKPLENTPDPWAALDTADGFVVCAENEDAARKIADANSGDESNKWFRPWLNHDYTACTLVDVTKEGLILRSFRHA